MTLSRTSIFHYAECRDIFIVILIVIRVSVVTLNVVMLSVVAQLNVN